MKTNEEGKLTKEQVDRVVEHIDHESRKLLLERQHVQSEIYSLGEKVLKFDQLDVRLARAEGRRLLSTRDRLDGEMAALEQRRNAILDKFQAQEAAQNE